MRSNEQNSSPSRPAVGGRVPARKPYREPHLTYFGTIAELTHNVGNDGDDGLGAGTRQTG